MKAKALQNVKINTVVKIIGVCEYLDFEFFKGILTQTQLESLKKAQSKQSFLSPKFNT